MNERDVVEKKVPFGEFPFPLSDGPQETPYLTWLRNHSNYMISRGFFDYLRVVGVLVRGIIVNFLILLPFLLMIALILGYCHHWMLASPYRATFWVLSIALGWILLFPIVMPLYKIYSYKRSLETGSDSSIKERDLYERSFGGFFFAVLSIALLESIPWALELRNDLFQSSHISWQGSVGSIVGVLAFLSGADKMLSTLKGARKRAAMMVIGLLGLLLPFLVILYATDFLVYGLPPTPNLMYCPLAVPIVCVIGCVVAIPLGVFGRAFSLRECAAAAGMLIAGVLFALTVIGVNLKLSKDQKTRDLRAIIDPLERVAAQFEGVTNQDEMTPEVAALVDEVVVGEREYKRMDQEIRRQIAHYTQQTESPDGSDQQDPHFLSRFIAQWEKRQQLALWRGRYFVLGQRIIALADELSAQPRGSLEPLRREVARLASAQLQLELVQTARDEAFQGAVDLKQKLTTFMSPIALSANMSQEGLPKRASYVKGNDTELARSVDAFNVETDVQRNVARLLRRSFVEWHIIRQCYQLGGDTAPLSPSPQSDDELRNWYSQIADRLAKVGTPQAVVKEAKRQSLIALQAWEVGEIALLVDEPELYREAEAALFSDDTVKHARLDGKAELAQLVSKGELIRLALKFNDDDELSLAMMARERLMERVLPSLQTEAWQGTKETDPSLPIINQLTRLAAGTTKQPWHESPTVPAGAGISNAAIARSAALRIAEFTVSQLGTIARGGLSADAPVGSQDALNHFRTDADNARYLPPRTLVERVRDGMTRAGDDAHDDTLGAAEDVPNVYDVQLVAAVLAARSVDFGDRTGRRETDMPRENRTGEPATSTDDSLLRQFARTRLIEIALRVDPSTSEQDAEAARLELSPLYRSGDATVDVAHPFTAAELAKIATAKSALTHSPDADKLIATFMFGKHGDLDRGRPGSGDLGELAGIKKELSEAVFWPKAIFITLLAFAIWFACWLTVDVNLTSIHGLYRDRLASAYLVGEDTEGNVDIEEDIDLEDICRYEARSIAPYHLINVALNLQGSKDVGIRDRHSDFFVFSKRYIGSNRTGYCRSNTMEQVFPQMSLATAMAISAAAASPNMGRSTSPLLVAFMTMVNIRMGYWMPNPGLLEERQDIVRWRNRRKDERQFPERPKKPMGYVFDEVFAEELREIERRWCQIDPQGRERQRNAADHPTVEHGLVGIGFSGGGIRSATINLGIAQALHSRGVFEHLDYMSTVSGGGYLGSSISALMRSRTKLASEIAGTVAVDQEILVSEIAGTVSVAVNDRGEQEVVVTPSPTADNQEQRVYRFSAEARLAVNDNQVITEGQQLIVHRDCLALNSAAAGSEAAEPSLDVEPGSGDKVVVIADTEKSRRREYRFSKDAILNVKDRENVGAGKHLLKLRATDGQSEIAGTVSVEHASNGDQIVRVQGVYGDEQRVHRFSRFEQLVVKTGATVKQGQQLILRHNTLGKRFPWRVPSIALLREMTSKLNESYPWVNLSDGGHLENLATIELLRRRCKLIIIGDGEADPELHFNGLATLIRFSRIDLRTEIDIDIDQLRLTPEGTSQAHWAIGRITYPRTNDHPEEEVGYLLYLKSSYTGDEDAVIKEYRHRNPDFPHQTTADQFFDEGQFEAYRALGQHIAEQALKEFKGKAAAGSKATRSRPQMSYDDLGTWLTELWNTRQQGKQDSVKDQPASRSASTSRRRTKKSSD